MEKLLPSTIGSPPCKRWRSNAQRIVAIGSDADIEKLKGPATQLIDLQRRTVIPGLIDNHAHYMRAAEYWHREVRLDGVTSHKRAMELLGEKVRESKPGEWVVVLGGWSEEQFTDEPRGFTRQELDELAPNNPVALQLFYFRVYANNAALKAMGIDVNTPDPANIKIEKDAQGQLTGALNGGASIGLLRSKLGEVARDKAVENAHSAHGRPQQDGNHRLPRSRRHRRKSEPH